MGKEVAGRTIKEYIAMIKMPLMWLIGLSILNFLIGLLGYAPGMGGVIGLITWPISLLISLVSLVIGGYIGYIIVKKYSGNLLTAAVAGALAGIISGFVGGVLGLLTAILSLSFGYGILGGFIITAAVIGLITSPIIGAIVGAILSVIGGAIAGSSSFDSKKA